MSDLSLQLQQAASQLPVSSYFDEALFQRELKRAGLPQSATDAGFAGIFAGLLGAKLWWTVEFFGTGPYLSLLFSRGGLSWFGGFTFVQASVRSGGKVVPLVQREEDEKFRSVFITDAKSGINKLEDLKGKTLSFGSQSSTSGHLMPRSFLLAAKINPDVDLKRVAFSGAHDATIAAVASGKVDAGAEHPVHAAQRMLDFLDTRRARHPAHRQLHRG